MKTNSFKLTLITCALAAAALTPAVVATAAAPSKETKAAPKSVPAGLPVLAPLPPLTSPVDNPLTPEKVELGKMLFWDSRLSGDASTPCVACHHPNLGWGDGGEISRGYPGTTHWRNSQTVLNSGHYNKLFWEGNVTSLEAQAPAAAEGNVAGNGDPAMMEMRLRFIPEYVARFKKVFGIEWPRITQAYMAIAAFQRTLNSDPAKVPFDRYTKGDKKALSEAQVRGMALYNGKAGCIQCHNGPLASDQKFYSLGVPENEVFQKEPLFQITQRWEHYQKGVAEKTYRDVDRDLGLYYQTKNPKDMGKFRTPSLRELKVTAPYMHSGVLYTLDEVVDFYNRGGGAGPNKSTLIKPLGLNDAEKKDLVSFLESLSMDAPLIVDDPKLPSYQVMK